MPTKLTQINLDGTVYDLGCDSYTAGTNITITNGVIAAPNVYSKTESDALYALDNNVYSKSQVYTKTEVDALFASIVNGDNISYGG